jgi:Flp pilus assembly protein TadD
MPPARTRADDVRAAEGFYRYGIGLLLQSDYQRARRAFRQAAALVPRRADIWIALGRVYLAEGDLLAARAQFQQALQLEPNNARAQAWLGYNYRLMGQFEDALKLLLPLAPKYPRDRRLWFHIGRSYFQNGQYEQAAYAFTQMLNVDPDDATAHFNLMSCFRRLRRISAARREEAIFRSLQEEEPPTSILEPFLAAHPEIRRETQPQHEHLLQGQ